MESCIVTPEELAEQELLSDLRSVNFDIERAAHSWVIFEESVRNFGAEQETLVEAIDSVEIGGTLNHLQMVLLHDSVGCLCRSTDEHKSDRITLNSICQRVRERMREYQPDRVRLIDQKRKAIVKSDTLAELRTFRNNELGHNLRTQTPPTKYSSIPLLISDISELLSDIFFLFGYAQWTGQSTISFQQRYAKEFWNCVQTGANARTTH